MQEQPSKQSNLRPALAMLAFLLCIGIVGLLVRFGWPPRFGETSNSGQVVAGLQGGTATPLNAGRITPVPTWTAAGPSPTPDCSTPLAWRVVGSPNLSTEEGAAATGAAGQQGAGEPGEEAKGGNNLMDIATASAQDVWSVGFRHNKESVETLAEHWNGREWSIAFSRNVGSKASILNSVAAAATNDVWAVGAYTNLDRVTLPLIEHWDGKLWSVSQPGNLASRYAQLNGVVVVPGGGAWAVGFYTSSKGVYRTLAQHWDGKAWATVPSPNVGDKLNLLTSVAARAGDDAWAVGYYVDEKNSYKSLTEHWDGRQWSVVDSPNPGTALNYLNDVAMVGPGEAWAAGYKFNGSGATQPLVVKWSGGKWSVVEAPQVKSSYVALNSISATSERDIWVAGTYQASSGVYSSLLARWNGTGWVDQAAPGSGISVNNLKAVWAGTPEDVWAAGYSDATDRGATTLIARYNDPCP